MQPIVTLTTDFGIHDHYVGTIKGVILNINPDVQIVDICHGVQPYDVLDGALIFAQAYGHFPAGTVHLVVVDPGVGTSRRAIVADTGRQLFIAPDNGVLSFVYDREERVTVRHVTATHYFLQPVSATFQGRDVFAPLAGYVSKGVALPMLGDVIEDYVRYTMRGPKLGDDKILRGVVLKVDQFGNLVTNIRPDDVPAIFQAGQRFRMFVGKGQINSVKQTFAEGAPGEVFALVGSMGFVEIVTNRGSAAGALSAGKGTEVAVVFE